MYKTEDPQDDDSARLAKATRYESQGRSRRRLTLLDEVVQFTLVIRRCRTASCARYRRAYRPEEEGALALPHEDSFPGLADLVESTYRTLVAGFIAGEDRFFSATERISP